MKDKKGEILLTIKNLKNVIKSVDHLLGGDELEDINFFITKLKKDVKNLKH